MTARTRARSKAAFDRAAYAAGVEAFLSELGEEHHANLSGRKPGLALAPVYERHGHLFSRDAIDALRRLAEDGSDEAAEARALAAFATDGHLERALAPLTEQIQSAETQAIVIWRGERIPFRSVPNRVAAVADRAERNALDSSYREAVEAMNPQRQERIERLHELTVELGYRDYLDMVHRLRGWDPDALGVEMQRFLTESETIYFAALRRYLARIEIEQGDGSVADMAHLLRGSGWDAWFEPRRMVPVAAATLAGLGLDLHAQPNIRLDLEERARKSARAYCIPVCIPDDVRLVVQPRGGWSDFTALLHELGHAEHFAHVDRDLPVAFRYLGDNSVTEGYAALLELLILEPAWLGEQLRMPEEAVAGFADFVAFWRLWLLRRYCAKLLYELRLHRGDDAAVNRAYYTGMLGLFTGVRTPEASYLADVDDNLYAGQYLRAWMLEAGLAASLRQQHGGAWWREPAAGETLRASWSKGQGWDAETVVAHLGYDRLDWRPVLRQIRTQLIGEMSGYGGPNITTRAGTRKV